MVWEDKLEFTQHLNWNSMETMKGFCYSSCFMYLKKILRPSTRMSENFTVSKQCNFSQWLDKELSNFPKILTFFVKARINNFQVALVNGKISGVLLCMCALLFEMPEFWHKLILSLPWFTKHSLKSIFRDSLKQCS